MELPYSITPGGVIRPVAESRGGGGGDLSLDLGAKTGWCARELWTESTRLLGQEPRQRIVGTIGMGNIASEAIRLLRVLDVAPISGI